MVARKTEMVQKLCRSVFFLWPPTEMRSFFCSVGGHKKTQTYETVHAFRSTVQNLPLRTRDTFSTL